MSLSTECLDASQVDSLLQGNLTPEDYEAAQSHVEQCESCRIRVEATIGPEQWWSDVQSVLLNNQTAPTSRRHASPTDMERVERSTNKILDLLGPTDDPNMLGRIGPYEIIGLLGQGGMGAVFKGFDRSLNRFVAIKMLLPHLAASGAARKRFAREGQAVAAVVDDHVMAIHCVDEWQGVPYLVMTYSRGVSLQKRLSDDGPLEVREILRIGMQTAKGLAAAHAQGIVHRDIKPANIFLDKTVERVQLMDFGLARAVDDASLTRTGVLAGTPQYMSPEQARAEAVDHRSDLFSLGSVMYAMCTSHAPFRAESSYSVLRLITDKDPRPIREISPDVPEWLCTIIAKLMAKQASERYQSAKEVSQLLEDCLAHLQQPAALPLPQAVAALAPKNSRRPPTGKLITAAAFAFALVFAGVFIVLELNKGTLTIQSDSDDVRVRITHSDEVFHELKVSKSGQSVRAAAGEYKVEIIGETDELVVENGNVTLHRAGTEVVRIVHNAPNHTKDRASVVPDAGSARPTSKSLLDNLQGSWHVVQHFYVAGIPKRRLSSATVRGNRMEISQGNSVGPMKFDLIIGESGPPQQIDLKVAMSEQERQSAIEDWGDTDKPMPELVLRGIIEVDGDLISICSTSSADSPHRPDEFMSGEEQMLWNFTRAAEHGATFERALTQRRDEDVGQPKKSPSPKQRTLLIEAPSKGLIRWGEGIKENSFVDKGALIARLTPLDPELHEQLANQLPAAKLRAEAAQMSAWASEESLKMNSANVEAHEARRKAYEQLKRQITTAAEAKVLSAQSKLESRKAEVAEQIALLELEQTEFAAQKERFEQALIPKGQLQDAEQKVKVAAARVAKSKAEVQVAENDLIAQRNEGQAKEENAQIDFDNANAGLMKAKAEAAKVESDLARVKLDLKAAQNEVIEIESKLAKQRRDHINAPFAGFVTELCPDEMLKAGDKICLLRPAAEAPQPANHLKAFADKEGAPLVETPDLSTPQATLDYIDFCNVHNPTHVPVDCYTDDALLEISGVMLQQLGYMSTLSQIYSQVDTQIRVQTSGVSDGKDSGPIIPGALPSFHLQVDALLKEHSLAMPPEPCKKAFELLLKSTVASLDGKDSRVIPDRELYRLAAGILKTTREFLPKASELSKRFHDSSSGADSHSKKVVSATQYDIEIDGDEAVATTLIASNSSAIPMKFKLRRVDHRWLVSEFFSDEILRQINLSMPQISGKP